MSKPWTPKRQTVELQPSRIRREPRPAQTLVRPRRSDEKELWFGVAGVLLMASALAALVIGIAVTTVFSASEAPARAFGQCYSAGGSDCVIDGDTIVVGGERIEIAGLDAPEIQGAACGEERERGIAAALRLSEILRSGEVTLGPAADKGTPRIVKVVGQDVAKRMTAAGLARGSGAPRGWC